MKITVAGCGRWGAFIAWYLDRAGHNVTLCARKGSDKLNQLINTRSNGLLTLSDSVTLSENIADSARNCDILVVSIASQALDSFAKGLAAEGIVDKDIVLCMKGMEIPTGRRLTEVIGDVLPKSRCAVWLGPGHVQEFVAGIPNCMVIDSENDELKQILVDSFSTDLIRFYYGRDLIGNEIGAASKNVIGIAAGMLDAMGLSSLKGALMSRGTREIARLIKASGGNELSAYGLCHLGDYEATVFSKYSHNRSFGEAFVKGEKFDALAEGYYTVAALITRAEVLCVDLPICSAVYNILYRGCEPKTELNALFARSLKKEF